VGRKEDLQVLQDIKKKDFKRAVPHEYFFARADMGIFGLPRLWFSSSNADAD
jgi:hypothetical protein